MVHHTNIASTGDAVEIGARPPAAILPADLIQDDEVVLLILRPSPWFIPLTSLRAMLIILTLTLALMWAARLPGVPWTESAAVGAGILLTILRLGWQALEWSNRVYVLTDRRVIRRKGVLRLNVFEAPLRNIQHTSVFARLRERLFGLGSIGFATAGSSTFEAFWVMIPEPFAVHHAVVEAIQRYGRR